MLKRTISLLLALVLAIGLLPAATVRAEDTYTTSQEALDLLKEMEGFRAYPYYDYSQYSVGYGTRCPNELYEQYAKEGITREEAEELLRQYLVKEETALNKFAADKGLQWTQSQFDALILFSYNCGTSWLYQPGEFNSAVANGTTGENFLYAICLWCNAGGEILPGLVQRRMKEANIYLNGVYSYEVPGNYGYVTYNPQGGTISSRIEAYDADLGHGPTVFAMRSGFTFDGWYTAKTGGSKVTVLDRSVSGKMLYARWLNSAGEVDVPETTAPAETTPPTTAPTTAPTTQPETTAPADETGSQQNQNNAAVTVTVLDSLNVRSGAGTGNGIIGSLGYGTKVEVTEVKSAGGYEWGKTSKGWICLYYTNYDSVVAGTADDTPVELVKGHVVDTNNLRIRNGAGLNYSILGYLTLNTPVEIMEQKTVNGMVWGKISQGWISMDYVALDSDVPAGQPVQSVFGKVVNSSFLRIRSGPGFSYGVVGSLDGGDRVEITDQKDADGMIWGRIDKGWISMDYIELENSSAPAEPEREPEQTTQPTQPAPTQPSAGETTGVYGTVINSSFLRIRSGAGLSYDIAGYLYSGNRVLITEQKEADGITWGKIEQGWISMDYIGLGSTEGGTTEETIIKGEVINCEQLRVRSGAGTVYSIEGYIKAGEIVSIGNTTMVGSTKWGSIGWGWISMDYIREVSDETPAVPAETPAETPTEAPSESTTEPEGNTSDGTMTGTVVNTGELRVRSGAGFSYSVVGYVLGGTTVEITECKSVDGMIWGKTSQGWVSLDYIELSSNTTGNGSKICVVNTDYLNVRSDAGTQYGAVTYYVRGDRVEILEEKTVGETAWGRTAKGWICLDYVK